MSHIIHKEMIQSENMLSKLGRIKDKLESITPGSTSVVWGKAVTRWGDNEFEVGVWGGHSVDVWMAIALISREAQP